jgi:segregation and condensation protein B
MPEQHDDSKKYRVEEQGDSAEQSLAPSLGPDYAALLESQTWQLDRAVCGDGELSQALPNSAAPSSHGNVAPSATMPVDARRLTEATPPPVRQIVEALLFVGGGPLNAELACAVVPGMAPADFLRCLDSLNRAYRLQGRPYRIRTTTMACELALRPKFLTVVEKIHGASREARLSAAALDVLSLVAYRQPLTKQEIDGVRGAESGAVLRQLVRRGLLTVVHPEYEGKAEPVYRTTRRFVEFFQLRGLQDLPQTQDLERL